MIDWATMCVCVLLSGAAWILCTIAFHRRALRAQYTYNPPLHAGATNQNNRDSGNGKVCWLSQEVDDRRLAGRMRSTIISSILTSTPWHVLESSHASRPRLPIIRLKHWPRCNESRPWVQILRYALCPFDVYQLNQ